MPSRSGYVSKVFSEVFLFSCFWLSLVSEPVQTHKRVVHLRRPVRSSEVSEKGPYGSKGRTLESVSECQLRTNVDTETGSVGVAWGAVGAGWCGRK